MADIELRAYVAQIEEMLAAENNDEAVAHARHVLEYFPKNLAVYRLLGKGYLEKRRFPDAGDIFYRVLSAAPDDFVAHVGLAIIGEEEEDLSKALGHMERAFEAQPSNAAIQAELRRLYGRRDGVEPARVRLTRGALARLYVRGGNYARAVSELRAALDDDPSRLDFMLLLAQALWKDEQRIDAVDVCLDVLQQLPFCLDANAILSEIWSSSGREDEAVGYWQRVEALDPYLAYDLSGAPSRQQVLKLPRLDYIPPTPDELMGVPDWVHDLGLSFDDGQDDDEAPGAVPPFFPEEGPTRPEDGSLLLGQAEGEADAVPDWLRDIVPSDEDEAIVVSEGQDFDWDEGGDADDAHDAEAIPDWLQDASLIEDQGEAEEPAPDLSRVEPAGVPPARAKSGALDRAVPDWLTAAVEWPDAEAATMPQEAGEDEGEDWLNELEGLEDGDVRAAVGQPAPTAGPEPAEEAPVAGEESDLALAPDLDFPPAISPDEEFPFDWPVDEAESVGAETKSEAVASSGQIGPQDVATSDEGEESAMTYSDEEWSISEGDEAWGDVPTDPDDALAWLEQLAANQGAPLEELPSMHGQAEPADEIPDWLKELAPTASQPGGAGEAGEAEVIEPLKDQDLDEIPDWLRPAPDETATAPTGQVWPVEEEEEFDLAEELPAWLQSADTVIGEPVADQQMVTRPISGRAEADLPDWLSGELTEDERVELDGELAAAGVGPEDVPADPDQAMAWLEDLAGQQGAPLDDLASLFAGAGQDEPAVPAWLEQTGEEKDEPALGPTAELPDWLMEEAAPVAVEPAAAALEEDLGEMPEDVDEAMAWLERLAARQGAPIEELPTMAGSDSLDTELPPWLEAEIETTDRGTVPLTEGEAELPAWLRDADEEEGEVVEVEPLAAGADLELPEWLQGRPEEEESEEAPELPEWLVDETIESVESEVADEASVLMEAGLEDELELPAWLRDEAPVAGEPELPAWLQEDAAEVGAPAPEAVGEEEEFDLADWQQVVPEADAVEEEALELPAWLQEEAAEVDAGAEEEEIPELPAWLQEELEEAPAEEEGVLDAESVGLPAVAPEEAEKAEFESLEWPEAEPAEPVVAAMPELDEPELPEWLRDEVTEAAESEVEADTAELTKLAELEEPEPPVWLQEELTEPELSADEETQAIPAEVLAAPIIQEPAAGLDDRSARLARARALMDDGAADESLLEYGELVAAGQELDRVVTDLSGLVQTEPAHTLAWRLLGDAFMRQGDLRQALESYRQALQQL